MQTSLEFQVRLFAGAAEIAGAAVVAIAIPVAEARSGKVRVNRIAAELSRRCPELAPLIAQSRWARDSDFVDETDEVAAADALAMIPPVSGG